MAESVLDRFIESVASQLGNQVPLALWPSILVSH